MDENRPDVQIPLRLCSVALVVRTYLPDENIRLAPKLTLK